MKTIFYSMPLSQKRLFFKFFYTLVCLLAVTCADATVRRVKIGGTGYGFSWATAFGDLQGALDFFIPWR